MKLIAIIIMTISITSCNDGNTGGKKTGLSDDSTSTSFINRQDWGSADGQPVYLFTLNNGKGIEAKISNYGGIISFLSVPDRNGKKDNIVLGFDSLREYQQDSVPYFGSLIGRYGNRIAKGRFSLNGQDYVLACNNDGNHLHGGIKGFDKVVWTATPVEDAGNPGLVLEYLSKDGEEGYPGNLKVKVVYTLTDSNELTVEYSATTDQPTPVNLTQHSYFNLTGDHSKHTILSHQLIIDADKYIPVDEVLIPTGELKEVEATPFDFRTEHRIGERIALVDGGYDHNWVLNGKGDSMQLAAILKDSISGRKMEVYTTEPGLQFYAGNFLNGSLKDSEGRPFYKHAGLALETQHFPDSPNQPSFPNTILQPGEPYHTFTKYKFISE